MKSKNRSGVTLVELMIAVAVLLIAVVPIFGMYSAIINSNAMAHKITLATFAAQQKIEEYVGLTQDEITNASHAAEPYSLSAHNAEDKKRTFPPDPAEPNGFTLNVYYLENNPPVENEAALITVFVEVLDKDGVSVLCRQSNIINFIRGGIA